MSQIQSFMDRRARGPAAVAAAVLYVAVGAHSLSAATDDKPANGRIDFEVADLPAATVEVDLTNEMFGDLFGLGDAAIAGVAETLLQSAEPSPGAEGTRLAAEQLAAARQIIQLAREVVQEVRVRAYRNLPEEHVKAETLAAHFDQQLRGQNWDNVVRVRDEQQSVRISLLRDNGAVRGIFIVAGHGREAVLANLVCDISPANIKKLTSAAAKIGLENGLAPVLEMKMRELNRRSAPVPPQPPQPARPEGDQ